MPFSKGFLCGSFGYGLFMCSHVREGKVVYIWISQDPAYAGLTLGVVVVRISFFLLVDALWKGK